MINTYKIVEDKKAELHVPYNHENVLHASMCRVVFALTLNKFRDTTSEYLNKILWIEVESELQIFGRIRPNVFALVEGIN